MIRLCQFTGVGSRTVKGGRRELKVREAGEQGTGGGRFWPPCPPPPPHWNRLAKLFETVTPPSKRMERQTTPYIAGQMSLHKSLSPQQEKFRIAIKHIDESINNVNKVSCCFPSAVLKMPARVLLFRISWQRYQKNNSSIKPNKFHSKHVCFGGRKTRKERKMCLKITAE